jgi:hypothetical protein
VRKKDDAKDQTKNGQNGIIGGAHESAKHYRPSFVIFDPRMAQRIALLEAGAERRFMDRDCGRGFEIAAHSQFFRGGKIPTGWVAG